ncbi:MAG TPA: DUF6049 family protein [Mycobacteriales bacterium]|nr:DUF6049 family protein [Mycobacteriales bacterium]
MTPAGFRLAVGTAALLCVVAAGARGGDPGPPASPGPVNTSASPNPTAVAAPPATPLELTITSLTPAIPQPGQTLVLAGRVTNRSATTVTSVSELMLFSPDRFSTRSQLDTFAVTDDQFGAVVDGSFHQVAPSLAPGATAAFRLGTPVNALGLTGVGSYPIGIEIQGSASDGSPEVSVLHTFLPWWPVGLTYPPRTPLGWVLPVTDRPHRAAAGFLDDQLAAEFSAGGRLGGLVAAGVQAEQLPTRPGQPFRAAKPAAGTGQPATPARAAVLPSQPVALTWAVDPMLVDDAKAMSAGYQVAGRPGRGRAAAAGWLHALSQALTGGDLLGLPYADPDIVALEHAGLDSQIAAAERIGGSVWSSASTAEPLPGTSWPPAGALDGATLDALAATGTRTVLLSTNALPPASEQYTPSAASPPLATPTGPVNVLVADDTLDAIVTEGAAGSASTARLAEQRFLAETLFINYEFPSLLRAVVIAPDRQWDPSPAYAAALLEDTGHAPWLVPMNISELLADGSIARTARQPLSYSASARSEELSAGYLAAVGGLQAQLDELEAILTRPRATDPLVRALETGLLRSVSSAWQSDPGGGLRVRSAVAGDLAADIGGVRVTTTGQVTLTSHRGTVPISIRNALPEPVIVGLFVDGGLQAQVTQVGAIPAIPPGDETQVQVGMTLQTTGVFPVRVQLKTPTGRPYGPQTELLIDSTAYGALALGITGGAFAVLLLAVAIRLTRRARGARRGRPVAGGG